MMVVQHLSCEATHPITEVKDLSAMIHWEEDRARGSLDNEQPLAFKQFCMKFWLASDSATREIILKFLKAIMLSQYNK